MLSLFWVKQETGNQNENSEYHVLTIHGFAPTGYVRFFGSHSRRPVSLKLLVILIHLQKEIRPRKSLPK